VAANGNDGNAGTLASPWLTIQYAVDQLNAGDILYIRGGTYTEKINITHSGTSLAPIIISSYPGETVVVDGNGLDAGLPNYTPIITMTCDYVLIKNIILTYPRGRGVFIVRGSDYNTVQNLNIHHMWLQGLSVWGDNNIIENNKIWQCALENSTNPGEGGWAGTLELGDSYYPYYGLNTIVRNNEVYQNYGEGILGQYTDNLIIQNNNVYDNWASGIYLDQCSTSTIKNNLIQYTSNTIFWRFATYPGAGILIANEDIISPSHPVGHDRSVFNNIIINAGYGFDFWASDAATSALTNDKVLHNTIICTINDADARGITIGTPNAAHQNTIIENNLIVVSTGYYIGYSASATGLTFSHNLWSKARDTSVQGTGDVIGDPIFTLDYTNLHLQTSSPAKNSGIDLRSTVPLDYDGVTRDTTPDMGAFEFV
jgi:parallel beta-helix repeat protein